MVNTSTLSSNKSSSAARQGELDLFKSGAPLGFAGGDANLTRYVGNSPTQSTDPEGLAALPKWQYEPMIYPKGVVGTFDIIQTVVRGKLSRNSGYGYAVTYNPGKGVTAKTLAAPYLSKYGSKFRIKILQTIISPGGPGTTFDIRWAYDDFHGGKVYPFKTAVQQGRIFRSTLKGMGTDYPAWHDFVETATGDAKKMLLTDAPKSSAGPVHKISVIAVLEIADLDSTGKEVEYVREYILGTVNFDFYDYGHLTKDLRQTFKTHGPSATTGAFKGNVTSVTGIPAALPHARVEEGRLWWIKKRNEWITNMKNEK